MLSMAYSAARDSQEGVTALLLQELVDSTTKETALAATALLLNCWTGQAAAATSGSRSSGGFTLHEVDAASEAFLQQRFGLQVGRRHGGGCFANSAQLLTAARRNCAAVLVAIASPSCCCCCCCV